MNRRLFILDANALLHRAWHALPPLTSPDGVVVNALYGVLMAVLKVLEREKPDAFVACWDTPEPTFRHIAFEAYKAQRERQADELYAQIPLVQEGLAKLGVPSLELPGFEADDLVGTLAKEACDAGWEVVVLTGDRDLLQMLRPGIEIWMFRKGVTDMQEITHENVQEIYGLLPAQVVDYKIMRGDASDNIPGIRGIGEKGAKELLAAYATLERIFVAAHDPGSAIPNRQRSCLLEGEKDLAGLRTLVTIRTDAPLPWALAETPVDATASEFVAFLRRYGFRSLLPGGAPAKPVQGRRRFVSPPPGPGPVEATVLPVSNVEEVKTCARLSAWLKDGSGPLAVHIAAPAGTMLPADVWFGCGAQAIQLAPEIWSEAGFSGLCAALFQERAADLVFHGAKQAFHAFAEQGIELEALGFDTQIAAYLLEANIAEPSLEDLAQRHLGYAGDWSRPLALMVLLSLRERLSTKLRAQKLEEVFLRFERPLVPILFRMEREGILLDLPYLGELAHLFAAEQRRLEKEMQELAGRPFNPASPAQLGQILFQDLGLPVLNIKKGKTGYSTAASELEKLRGQHPIIEKIEEYREVSKLFSTYIQPLPTLADACGRVHTTFNQAVASTGRLSSTNPNLQNIPIRTEYGRRIRRAFVAPPGRLLLSCDYSQVELRIAAALAKDEVLRQAFLDGEDIHKTTAAAMWSVPLDQVTPDQRRAAKAVNFGVLYGQGAFGLSAAAGISMAEAKEFIERYFGVYAQLRSYLDGTKAFVKKNGFVETFFGRRRPVPEIFSAAPMVRAQAERMAVNMPIQGTAADILKLAMIEIAAHVRAWSPTARLVLQVHDELVFEIDAGELDVLVPRICKAMETVVDLGVPLAVEAKYGENWGEMVPYMKK